MARFKISYGSTAVGGFDLPGADVTGAQIAQRRADAPLKPKVYQRPCDAGLFSDDANQIDLVDFISRGKK